MSAAREPDAPSDPCRRPDAGSAIAEPQDLRSVDGILKVDLALYNSKQPDGSIRYCYVTPDGAPSPTLRVNPGDQLILQLRNKLVDVAPAAASTDKAHDPAPICHSQSVNVETANKTHVGTTDAAGGSFCFYQGPAAVHLEVRQTSVAAILSAMAETYEISFRSSVPLSELRNGRYVGPMRSVISEVLRGYDYAITHQHSHLDIIVFDKSGGQPVAPPLTAEPTPATVSEAKPPRSPVTVSRTH